MAPAARSRWFRERFGNGKAFLGVVHLAPLPGSPRCEQSLERTLERALADAERYRAGGAGGVVVENFGDAPFLPGAAEPHTIAILARAAAEIRAALRGLPVGINVLRNDALGALGAAVASGAEFIRVNVLAGVAVTDQGLVAGEAARLLRYRKQLGSDVQIFADLHVKHATQLRTERLDVEVAELVGRALADALLVTGPATGMAPDVEFLADVRAAAAGAPVLVASGASADNVAALAQHCDGFIAGTALKRGGRTEAAVDERRVAAFRRALARTGAGTRG